MPTNKLANKLGKMSVQSDSAASSICCKIDPLVGRSNWSVWRQQFINFLWKCGPLVLEMVTDERRKGGPHDAAVKRYLKQACSPTIQELIASQETAYDMWNVLEMKYGCDDFNEAIELRKQFANSKLANVRDDVVWLEKMLDLYSKICTSTKEWNMEQEFVYNVILKVQEKTNILKYLNDEIKSFGVKCVPMTIDNIFDLIRTYLGELDEKRKQDRKNRKNKPSNSGDKGKTEPEPEPDNGNGNVEEEIEITTRSVANPGQKVETCSLIFSHKPGTPSPVSSDTWVIHTGSTNHFCSNRKFITNLRPIEPVRIRPLAGDYSVATSIGEVLLLNDTNRYIFTVYYLPGWITNILSIGQLSKHYANVNTEFLNGVENLRVSNENGLLIEATRTTGPHIVTNLRAFDFTVNQP